VATVNVHEAKTHLSRLLARVEAGEKITIARNGRPVARLTRVSKSRRAPQLGWARGRIRIAGDFNAPLPKDVLDAFYK
jgi:prevent-host-death family protein